MKAHGFIVNANKLLVAVLTAGGSLLLAASLFTVKRYGGMAFFLLIAALFILVACINGCEIRVGEDGVRRTLLGRSITFIPWSVIQEIGVAGSKVFLNDDKDHVGTLYIYFSEVPMDDDARFQMMLKWPPSDKLYMTYSRERMLAVQTYWSSRVETYHAGPISFS